MKVFEMLESQCVCGKKQKEHTKEELKKNINCYKDRYNKIWGNK